jgi:ferredoxin-thioredoxin reductase catalytic subunit
MHMAEITQEELEEEILKWAEEYARKNGWTLNPDDKQLKTVIRGLARNTVRFGEQYCPCRIRSGDPEEDRKIVCPCIYHRDEVEKDGQCHCHLYFRENTQEK